MALGAAVDAATIQSPNTALIETSFFFSLSSEWSGKGNGRDGTDWTLKSKRLARQRSRDTRLLTAVERWPIKGVHVPLYTPSSAFALMCVRD